jgi:two-component system, cell cycle sensor histidine kinase and response regulator CckA
MTSPLRLLIVEDRNDDAELMALRLKEEGFAPEWQRVETAVDYLTALEQSRAAHRPYDLILCDWRLPQFDGLQALRLLREAGDDTPFILVSGSIGEETAVDLLRAGADDYVLKDRPGRLGQAARHALADRQLRQERRQAEAALRQREAILEAVAFTAAHFLGAVDWETEMDAILARLGQATGVSRIYVFENSRVPRGKLFTSQRFEWCAPAVTPQIDNPALQKIPIARLADGRWASVLGQGELLYGHVRDMFPDEQAILAPQGILSLAVLPVFANEQWWGFVGFDQCDYERDWSPVELESLRAAVNTLGVAIERKRAVQTLRAERDFSAQILNAMGQGVTVVNADGHIQYANPTLAQMIGRPINALLGLSPIELVHPASLETLQEAWALRETGQSNAYELRLLHADGRELFALITGTPRYHDGKFNGAVAVITDITGSKERERELKIMAAISAAMRGAETRAELLPVVLDQVMLLLNVEGAALELLNQASGELLTELGRGIWAPLTGVPIPPGAGLSAQVLASGQPYLNNDARNDPRLYRPDSFGNCCAAAGVPLAAQGRIIGLLWVGSHRLLIDSDLRLLQAIADIVANAIQRESLREAINEQAQQLQTILDTVPEGVLLLNEAGRILLANPVAAQTLGTLAQQDTRQRITHLAGRPLAEFTAPAALGHWHELEVEQRFFQLMLRPLAQGNEQTEEDNGRRWVLVFSDETALRERQRYQQAQERLAVVGQLAAGIAHDFNNIMGTVVLYTDLLDKIPELTERQRYQLNTIRTQANRAANLVQQILDFSRRSVSQRQPLDLLPLIKELLKLWERILPENIRLELGYDRRDYLVNADATQMQQVFMNLALNARDAMPNGGTLRLALTTLALAPGQPPPLPDLAPRDWVQITVTDSGTGIPPELLPHIFEPFFTTKGPGAGTGLGLSQVYGIVQQHKGAIGVQSRLGVKTIFSIYLPALAPTQVEQERPSPQVMLRGSGETILLVEDDATLQEATAELLELLGYRVLQARHGEEALVLLAREPVALVLSDLVMPQMGGATLSKRLQEMYPQTRLILMTGHAPQGEHAWLLQGETTWLQKPFDANTLATAVQAALVGT